jgi:predicted DNA-binding transcriptional regulator YafY
MGGDELQESRLFRILYYLLDKGHAAAPELAEKFEVSVRMIYRDVDAISSAGIPIYVTTGRNGGIQFLDDYVLNKSFFFRKVKSWRYYPVCKVYQPFNIQR